jgi:hypothetical protein
LRCRPEGHRLAHRSRLAFVARDLPREFAEMLLDAIETEVRETIRST